MAKKKSDKPKKVKRKAAVGGAVGNLVGRPTGAMAGRAASYGVGVATAGKVKPSAARPVLTSTGRSVGGMTGAAHGAFRQAKSAGASDERAARAAEAAATGAFVGELAGGRKGKTLRYSTGGAAVGGAIGGKEAGWNEQEKLAVAGSALAGASGVSAMRAGVKQMRKGKAEMVSGKGHKAVAMAPVDPVGGMGFTYVAASPKNQELVKAGRKARVIGGGKAAAGAAALGAGAYGLSEVHKGTFQSGSARVASEHANRDRARVRSVNHPSFYMRRQHGKVQRVKYTYPDNRNPFRRDY